MNAERSQLYYACVFLHVSFQAIQHSVACSSSRDDTPCWLDAQTMSLLLRELQLCRRQAGPLKEVYPALDTAFYHCGLLMAQCPAAINRPLCQHHLEAIIAPLKEATAQLSGKVNQASESSDLSPGKRFRRWLGW
ncbi:hypothetical protein RSO68_00070 [Halomonas saccharevitans]|uniref:Uncharacterized protein n=1 Tax=Halomonas saccharevitans TaxID=416872 RepID=A0ABU3NA00_9GAMM|nr:hypothetical protein [Halomonas saccharevitans]MDT8877862.1 hypothetical protein [Halomonas saccharevitans]